MQFYEQNQFRAYPFREDAVLDGAITGSGSYTIPNPAFVDVRITLVRAIPEGPTVLQSITRTADGICMDFWRGGYPLPVTLPVLNNTATRGQGAGRVYSFLVVTGSALTDLAEALGVGGAFIPIRFPELLPTLVRDASGASVCSISDGVTPLTGKIVLEEGYNCAVAVTGTRIHISPRKGAGAGASCEAGNVTCASALFRINGQEAGPKGEFKLVGGKGVAIVARPAQHTLDIMTAIQGADECKV